jgi:MFS family permease
MTERLKTLATSPRLTWLLIAVGVFLRLVHYLHSCSLSVDESLLTLNVLARSHAELIEPLHNSQGAPVAFLLLLKSVIGVFGESEYALRLIALVSGIASLFLFRSLATRYLTPAAVPIAVGLFAVAHNLIFYSAQVKQYSGDVMFALVLYLMAEHVRRRKTSWWLMPLFGLVGAVALGFSHPAVFILAGLAVSFTYFNLVRAGQERRLGALMAFTIWGVAFLVIYWLSLRKLASHEWLLNFWEDEFMPLPPTSMDDVKWYITAFFQMFTKMLGFSLKGIGGLTVLVGVYSLLTSDRERLANLILPIFLALGASGLQMYPFCCRLILFAAPALLLLMAEGAVTILSVTRMRSAIGITLLGLMFLHPVMWAGYHVVHPRYEEEIKPELRYLEKNRQPGDVIYIYYGAKPAFTYYARRYGWDVDDCCIVGARSREDWDGYEQDLEQLRGQRRAWIVFSHIFDWKEVDDRALFLQLLDNIGERLDGFETHGAAIYLYDLSRPVEPTLSR